MDYNYFYITKYYYYSSKGLPQEHVPVGHEFELTSFEPFTVTFIRLPRYVIAVRVLFSPQHYRHLDMCAYNVSVCRNIWDIHL